MVEHIKVLFFSPTGHTRQVARTLAKELKAELAIDSLEIKDITLPGDRAGVPHYGKGDLVLIAVPVFGGRVPDAVLPYLNTIHGAGSLGVPLVVYGNRAFDDALVELQDVMEDRGITTISGGAFIGEHSYSTKIAKGRPDDDDIKEIKRWARDLAQAIKNKKYTEHLELPGNRPYKKKSLPKDEEGNTIDLREVTPFTDETCLNCKFCAKVCPVGAIDPYHIRQYRNQCIKCNACIKKCPMGSKSFIDPDYIKIKERLEATCMERKDPEYYV